MSPLSPRSFEPDDLVHLQQWLNREEIYKNLYVLYHPMTHEELLSWYHKELSSGARVFMYHADHNKQPAGLGMIHYIHPKNRCGELSIIVGPEETNKGFGTRILLHLMDFAFGVLNLHKIFFHTASYNEQMLSIVTRMEFVKEATYRQELFWRGTYHDIYRFGMLAEEYFIQQQQQT